MDLCLIVSKVVNDYLQKRCLLVMSPQKDTMSFCLSILLTSQTSTSKVMFDVCQHNCNMVPSFLYNCRRRAFPAVLWRRLIPFVIALKPITNAFIQPINKDILCSNYNHHHHHQLLASRSYKTSIFLSNNCSTQGSPAVKSLKPPLHTDAKTLQLVSFYRFISITQPDIIRDELFEHLKTIEGLRGTVYVSKEGINAQFAVPPGRPLETLLQAFRMKNDANNCGYLPFDMFEKTPPNLGSVVNVDTPTFDRLIVRTRDQILRDGIANIIDEEGKATALEWDDCGTELSALDWDKQLRLNPDIQLLDCRNHYESEKGTFASAKPLNTQTFSETWSILDSQVEKQSINTDEPVYIYCTGGIRCVKVGAYMKQKLGIKDVRSLKHGIIGYEKYIDGKHNDDSKQEGEASLWVGENFLFDKRRTAKEEDRESDEDVS